MAQLFGKNARGRDDPLIGLPDRRAADEFGRFARNRLDGMGVDQRDEALRGLAQCMVDLLGLRVGERL